MSTETACREAAERLLGQVLARVRYVGLTYDEPDEVRWDFEGWHWPEVGVELSTAAGDTFYGIWDSKVTNFELTFAEGPISDEWPPLQDSAADARAWDVSDHPRWSPFIGTTFSAYDLALAEPDDPTVRVPVAIRVVVGIYGCAGA